MNRIYFDNGATSWPKAPGVAEAMTHFTVNVGCNVGRGAYEEAFEAQRVMLDTREMLNELVNGPGAEHVIFTMNITMSMNMLLKGLLKPGDEVITTSLEHNAVLRPLHVLKEKGVVHKTVACNAYGELDLDDFKSLLTPKTKAVVMTHASNVSGTLQPLAAVGKLLADHSAFFIADCAQTAGLLPIDMTEWRIDAVAFTGHKSLLGPQGTGGFILNDRLNEVLETLIEGGTGSHSESEEQPEMLPDKFESGTPNTVGIYGLHAALTYLKKQEPNAIFAHELLLTDMFIKGVLALEHLGVRLIGRPDIDNRVAVVSLNFEGYDNAEVSYMLQKQFCISNRVGMHCAPMAHKALGTFPMGTVRFSFSSFNTLEEVQIAIGAIETVLKSL